jgi:hypothetical protein
MDGGAIPFHDERVEAVERAENALHKPAALRGGGVRIRYSREVLRHCWLAMHGNAMTRFSGLRVYAATPGE